MRRLIPLFTLIFLAVLATDLYPGLRGGSGWRWPYAPPESWPALVALAAILLVYLAFLWWMRSRDPRPLFALPVMIAAGALIGVATVGVHGDTGFLLFTRTVSPVQTGASAVAVRIMAEDGLQATLERWPDVMREARDQNLIHFTTSPPGQPLFHYAAADLLDRHASGAIQPLSMDLRLYQCSEGPVAAYTRGEMVSAGLGMLMPLYAALAVIPLYAAARMLSASRRTALAIAGWWPLVPSIALFAPTWNTLYPALSVTAFALLLAGLCNTRSRFAAYTFAAGVVTSLTTFLNFAVLPILLLFGLFTLGATWRQRHPLWRSVIAGTWFGAGLSTIWLGFYLATGWTPFDLLEVTFGAHTDLVQREYLPWLLLHPYDVLMFAGWPLAALFGWGVWRSLRNRASGEWQMAHILALSMFITFAAVNLAGVAQGENARILTFYVPFLLLGGLGVLAIKSPQWDMPLLSVQALSLLVMAAVLPVIPQDLNDTPTMPRADVPPLEVSPPNEVNAAFQGDAYPGALSLQSYRFVADVAAQTITLETVWNGQQRPERPYEIESVARAENDIDGEIITDPQRWPPQNGNYRTTCWRDGDLVRDVTLIELPTISAPVVWTLSLRMVDPRTGDVMRVTLPDGTTGTTVELGPVRYP